jgi:hypothetical protein
MDLILWFVISSVSKKKEPRCACRSEAKASHSHNMDWVSSSVPHFLQVGLLLNPITYRCLLRVLHPVRRPVTTLDCVLLKESNQAFVAGLGPEINFRACLWVLQGPHHIAKCLLSIHCLILLLIFCLETPRDGSGPINWVEPPLASLSGISLLRTPACPGTQYSPTLCPMEISFNAFWHCHTNVDVVLAAWRAFRAAWLSWQILVYCEFQFHICRLISQWCVWGFRSFWMW